MGTLSILISIAPGAAAWMLFLMGRKERPVRRRERAEVPQLNDDDENDTRKSGNQGRRKRFHFLL